ncbi:MAG: hypothetical protein KF814_12035 [Nitrospiraceae bacterium]|nr:hypothetical protein [Nitrospiraceae bacterium]
MPLRRSGNWALVAVCVWVPVVLQAAPQAVAPSEALEADFLDFLESLEQEDELRGDPFQEPPVEPSPEAPHARGRADKEKALTPSRKPAPPAPVKQGSATTTPQSKP